jgi:uncharacterized protein (DUF1330 family)
MAAYVIVNVHVEDPVRYEDYKTLSTKSVTGAGGRFLARGGKVETLEGTWIPERFVILEFPDAAAARAWWGSAGYAPAKALRQATAKTEMILVEGV